MALSPWSIAAFPPFRLADFSPYGPDTLMPDSFSSTPLFTISSFGFFVELSHFLFLSSGLGLILILILTVRSRAAAITRLPAWCYVQSPE
jgi:hypothetical protein